MYFSVGKVSANNFFALLFCYHSLGFGSRGREKVLRHVFKGGSSDIALVCAKELGREVVRERKKGSVIRRTSKAPSRESGIVVISGLGACAARRGDNTEGRLFFSVQKNSIIHESIGFI